MGVRWDEEKRRARGDAGRQNWKRIQWDHSSITVGGHSGYRAVGRGITAVLRRCCSGVFGGLGGCPNGAMRATVSAARTVRRVAVGAVAAALDRRCVRRLP